MAVVNAFTVDLEDWFQGLTSTNACPEEWHRYESRIEANTKRLLCLLDEYDVRATFFVLGHVAHHYPALVTEVEAAGHEIGVHGYWHRMVHRLTPEQFVMEFPISTARWGGRHWPIGGGFYVRSLPYRVIGAGIRQLNGQGKPVIMYVHPWELDTGQRYRRVTLRERITHYHGRAGLERKLRRLFTEFDYEYRRGTGQVL